MAPGTSAVPRVGLVLGAGGVIGGAWLTGALAALTARTGWDPGSADRILGTSAGSMIGALLACGIPPWYMIAHSAGETFEGLTDAAGNPAPALDRSAGGRFAFHRAVPRVGPGSLQLAWSIARAPRAHPPGALLAALAPYGLISTEPLKEIIRGVNPGGGWAPHPGLRVVAYDLAAGRRVAFGDPTAPAARLEDAVAASCAIPGFYRPVRIDGRVHVDGGTWSASNLDLLAREELDLVIALNPMSSREDAGGQAGRRLRSVAGRRLGREAKRLEAAGTKVLLIQPTSADFDVMGENLMSSRRRHQVVETAMATVAGQLHDAAATLAVLPAHPNPMHWTLRRPDGPPAGWPHPNDAASERFVA